MKKIEFFFLVAFFIHTNVSPQKGCLRDGVTFNTQAQIDNFLINNPYCDWIEGYVRISGNDITNLNGLENINLIAGRLTIEGNPSLASLKGLDNLQEAGGYYGLVISNNSALTDLSALNNLTDARYVLFIINNDVLTSLYGLNNLSSVREYINISDNDALIDLSDMESLSPYYHSLRIYNNSSLSSCHVKGICDYLANPDGVIEIHDNAAGCNSQKEVEIRCNTTYSIYPIPAKNELFIIININVILKEVNIYDYLGKLVLHETQLYNVIDVSMLKQGIYIIEIITNDYIKKEKLIIH